MNLLLVAHPDDEVIFAGGLLMQGGEWTICCATYAGGEERGKRFLYAVEVLRGLGVRATPMLLGLRDEGSVLLPRTHRLWEQTIEEACVTEYDLVVTHNRLGEYGHPHHMAVAAIALTLFPRVESFYTTFSPLPQDFARLRSVPYFPGKLNVMREAYPELLQALMTAYPEMILSLFNGPERFTTT